MNYAVIKSGGKQYKVSEGDTLSVEKLGPVEGGFTFEEVLMIADGDKVTIGKPNVAGAKVEAKIIEEGKAKKKMVFRYKSKTRYRKKKGHRQPYTKVQITKILS